MSTYREKKTSVSFFFNPYVYCYHRFALKLLAFNRAEQHLAFPILLLHSVKS